MFVLSAHDTPSTHPTILQDERDYIERSIGDTVTLFIFLSLALMNIEDKKLFERVLLQLSMEVVFLVHARVGNYCGEFLPQLDVLYVNYLPIQGMV